MRRLYDSWRFFRPEDKIALVDMPATKNERSIGFLRDELEKLAHTLSEWSGNKTDAAAIKRACCFTRTFADRLNCWPIKQGEAGCEAEGKGSRPCSICRLPFHRMRSLSKQTRSSPSLNWKARLKIQASQQHICSATSWRTRRSLRFWNSAASGSHQKTCAPARALTPNTKSARRRRFFLDGEKPFQPLGVRADFHRRESRTTCR